VIFVNIVEIPRVVTTILSGVISLLTIIWLCSTRIDLEGICGGFSFSKPSRDKEAWSFA
jgi:hypothetical protein